MPLNSLKKKLSRSVTSLLLHSSSSETSLIESSPPSKTDTLAVTVYQNRDAWDSDKGDIAAAISIDFTHRTAADILPDNTEDLDQESVSGMAYHSTFRSEMAKTQEACFQIKLKELLKYRIGNLDRSLTSSYPEIMSELVNEAPGSVCVKSLAKLGVDCQVIKHQILPGGSGLAEMMKQSTWLLVSSPGKVYAPKGPPKPSSDPKTGGLFTDISWMTLDTLDDTL